MHGWEYKRLRDVDFCGNVYPEETVSLLKALMDPSYEILIRLLAAAVEFSGLPAIHVSELPPVIMMPREELNRTVCVNEPIRCTGLMAAFDTERYRILVDSRLDLNEASDNSFLVHEIVHVLQLKQAGSRRFTSCRAVISSEREAYDVQNRYLMQNSIPAQHGSGLRFARCPEPEDVSDTVQTTGTAK